MTRLVDNMAYLLSLTTHHLKSNEHHSSLCSLLLAVVWRIFKLLPIREQKIRCDMKEQLLKLFTEAELKVRRTF